jgi:hypothetical protein
MHIWSTHTSNTEKGKKGGKTPKKAEAGWRVPGRTDGDAGGSLVLALSLLTWFGKFCQSTQIFWQKLPGIGMDVLGGMSLWCLGRGGSRSWSVAIDYTMQKYSPCRECTSTYLYLSPGS